MRWTDLATQSCPVARGLSVIGDRWTLLILRDCFLGIRRFEQLQARLGVTRHVLADRLRKLEAAGVLERKAYQERPLRHEYRLTEAGKALYPVMVTLMAWADAHAPAPDPEAGPRILDRETGLPVQPVVVDATTGAEITHRTVIVERPD